MNEKRKYHRVIHGHNHNSDYEVTTLDTIKCELDLSKMYLIKDVDSPKKAAEIYAELFSDWDAEGDHQGFNKSVIAVRRLPVYESMDQWVTFEVGYCWSPQRVVKKGALGKQTAGMRWEEEK